MDGLLSKLKGLDACKVNEDFYKRTLSGGVVTLLSAFVMLLLFVSETIVFYSATETKLVVEPSRGERLDIPCTLLSVDTKGILVASNTRTLYGLQSSPFRHDIEKKRLDSHGSVIESRKEGIGGTKVQSDEQCCNSCEEVRECAREDFVERVKTQHGEGCSVHGFLDVSKGYYESNVDMPELSAEGGFNITHKINKLSFGTEFPGAVNPLDGAQWTQPASDGTYQYFIKVVPTIYNDIRGRKIDSNQMEMFSRDQPGVFFFYDFSPIKENRSFLHYLTNLCAIIGIMNTASSLYKLPYFILYNVKGIFTVAGIIDSFIYHGQKALKKKME
ncbi:hypothetical protein ZWY2020_025892 [Hordeum vulgare]|nr:hypothetical protein ZWY2020_025892 [Hordeum vulgare]